MAETVGLNVKFTGDSSGVVQEARQGERALDQYGNEVNKTGARSKQFSKQSAAMSKSLRRARKSLNDTAKSVTLVGAAMATAAAAGMARFISKGLEAGDALAKTSDKLGVATEKLAGLRLAAERSGVAAGAFDTALQRLTRRTAEAAQGTGAAKDAFEALGLSASEMARLSPDKVLARVADAMQGVDSQSEKVALAFKLFDTEGVALVNTLAGGSAGLDKFNAKAEALGIAISRDVAGEIEAANDALADITTGFEGLSLHLSAEFAPLLKLVGDRFFENTKEAGGMGEVASEVFQSMVTGAKWVLNSLDGINRTFKLIVIGWKTIGDAFSRSVSFMANILEKTPSGLAIRNWMAIWGFVKGEGYNLPSYKDSQMAETLGFFRQDLDKLAADLEDVVLDPLAGDSFEAYVAEARQRYTKLSEVVVEGWNRATDSINGAQVAVNQTSEAFSRLVPVIGPMRTIFDDAKDSANELGAAAVQTANAWENAGGRMSRSLEGAFAGLIQRGLPIGGGGFGSAIGGALSSSIAGGLFSGGGGGSGGGNNGGTFGALAGLRGLAGGLGAGAGNLFTNINGGLAGLSVAAFGQDNILQNLLGKQFSANNAFGQALGFEGSAATGIGALGSIGGGILGGIGGNKLGEALFGKQAESSVGRTIGGLAGSFGGPVGSLVGSLIGGLADVAFGGDGKKRFNAGIVQGRGVGTLGSEGGAVKTGASGLEFQTFNRRAGAEGTRAADAFLETVLGLDQALTALTESTGANVDFSRTTLGGINADAGKNREGPFFGLKGFNGTEGSLEDAADEFVSAWLDEVNSSLPKRVRQILNGVDGTAQEIVGAFEQAISIDRLLDLDVVKRTEEALKEFGKASGQSLLTVYDDLTEAVLEASAELDGSAMSLANLNSVLGQQKSIAAELAAAYKVVGIEVDAALGNTIQNIRESILNEEQLYSLRRDQIADITAQIAQTTDPGTLRDLSMRANQLIGSTFGNLEESQQQALAPEYIALLERIEGRVDNRISQGEASLGSRERGVRDTVDMELAANTQMAASQSFGSHVERFGQLVERMERAGGGGEFRFPAQINSPIAGYHL